ncbi:MAG: class I SAM-dependent methyltransferase [Ktedonobacterales bacterium]|nr:class I SAM-dependent methyltransferase [Ktedonobacterales bacterium]
MNHADHVRLIHGGIVPGDWADLGSGGGAFTLALADLLAGNGTIHSVDQDAGVLREQAATMRQRFPSAQVTYLAADFTRPLTLTPLDGIVMANSLHFVRDKVSVLRLVRSYLKPGGRLVLVEYNADGGNMWVPYPFSYPTWERLATQAGFTATRQLATIPSRFLREIYAALSISA